MEEVVIIVKRKGSQDVWKPLPQILVKTVEEAKKEIRDRSDVIDAAFDFAIKVTTIEEFSERSPKHE